MVLPIVKEPAPSLRERSEEVDHFFLEKEETKQFIASLIETMYATQGIGIAATQVGRNMRICIIGKEAIPGKEKDLVLVNPVMEKTSKKMFADTEGCLSVPRVYGKVRRLKDIAVEALNEYGEPFSFEAHNFFARVIQHEIDHLNGTLFIDKATDVYAIDEKERKQFLADLREKRNANA